MSFILDALRKSEHARERRALPGLVDLPVSHTSPSRLPWILGGVGVLLLVNIVVLFLVLARPSAPPAAVTAATPAATAGTARTAGAPAPSAALPAAPRPAVAPVRPLAAEPEPGADPELERPAVPPPPRTAREPYAAERAAAEREFHPRTGVAGVPSIHNLPAQATAGLAPLNIDLHVYSADPAQRFVIINGQRLHEGGQIKEGPTVEQITPEGAILDHQGTRFLLPRE
jgi:general secretion pathway protein B